MKRRQEEASVEQTLSIGGVEFRVIIPRAAVEARRRFSAREEQRLLDSMKRTLEVFESSHQSREEKLRKRTFSSKRPFLVAHVEAISLADKLDHPDASLLTKEGSDAHFGFALGDRRLRDTVSRLVKEGGLSALRDSRLRWLVYFAVLQAIEADDRAFFRSLSAKTPYRFVNTGDLRGKPQWQHILIDHWASEDPNRLHLCLFTDNALDEFLCAVIRNPPEGGYRDRIREARKDRTLPLQKLKPVVYGLEKSRRGLTTELRLLLRSR